MRKGSKMKKLFLAVFLALALLVTPMTALATSVIDYEVNLNTDATYSNAQAWFVGIDNTSLIPLGNVDVMTHHIKAKLNTAGTHYVEYGIYQDQYGNRTYVYENGANITCQTGWSTFLAGQGCVENSYTTKAWAQDTRFYAYYQYSAAVWWFDVIDQGNTFGYMATVLEPADVFKSPALGVVNSYTGVPAANIATMFNHPVVWSYTNGQFNDFSGTNTVFSTNDPTQANNCPNVNRIWQMPDERVFFIGGQPGVGFGYGGNSTSGTWTFGAGCNISSFWMR